MNVPRRAARAVPVLALAISLVLTAGCASEGAKTDPPGDRRGEKDKEFRGYIESLARTCEALDQPKIVTFYGDDVYIHFLEFTPRTHDGKREYEGTVKRFVDSAERVLITLGDEYQVWKGKERTWTLQPFVITAQLKDGRKATWEGRHSAIWEKKKEGHDDARRDRDGWVIIYEHLIGPPAPGFPENKDLKKADGA